MRKCQVIGCSADVFVGKHDDYEVENRFLCRYHWIHHAHVAELKPFEFPHEPTEVVYQITFSDAEYPQDQLRRYLGLPCDCLLCKHDESRTIRSANAECQRTAMVVV